MLKRLNSRGDTIIEVLIAMAILGFAMTTAYSILNQSLISARNAQEHSEALEYMNSQVELVRFASSQPTLFTQTAPFCMLDNVIKPAADPACRVGQDGIYVLSITMDDMNVPGEPDDVYTFNFSVNWPGPGSTGPQKEEISYKIYEDSV